MAAIKTVEERELIKNELTKVYLRGYTFRGMAKHIQENLSIYVSHKTCSNYITQILNEWHKERIDSVDKWITAELMGLNEVEKEAWAAWELSKKDKTKSMTRSRGKRNDTTKKITTTGVEQYDEVVTGYGDPRFLEIIKDCKLQRLQYLTKGSFGADGNTTNVYMQQVVEIGVMERTRPPEEPHTINIE